jgi:hypothetical protein
MVVSNTSTQTQQVSMSRFQEVLNGATKAKNLLTNEMIDLQGVTIKSMDFLLLEIQN